MIYFSETSQVENLFLYVIRKIIRIDKLSSSRQNIYKPSLESLETTLKTLLGLEIRTEMKSSDKENSISPGSLYGFPSELLSYREFKIHNSIVKILIPQVSIHL